MSDFRVKPITPAQMTGSAATFYTAPTACKSAKILALTVTNTDTTPYTFTGNRVPSGGSAAVANEIYNAEPIAAGATVSLAALIGMAFAPGDFLQFLASVAAKLSVQGSVVEFY